MLFEMSQSLTFREECRSSFQTQSWRVLIADSSDGSEAPGKDYLVKSLFEDACYHVMFSDCSAVWEERIDGEAIKERLKVPNSKAKKLGVL